ncbi:IS1/IS1595 family N-terminal zinc-binding domain-containing protein [Dapis sp. BLCC M229]|uniref:IS1/IS1595 family N-terminal zinc-binding domain-containing protein n=1 Tax=Dapis sp. BLCC M229 TaxID=3400188 RepID=UPI003CEB7318
MICPKCNSTHTRKNGRRRDQQCFQCRICGRQFVDDPKSQPYSPQMKELRLLLHYLKFQTLPT